MRRTLEISASFTGTIATAQYENAKPFYSVKEILELDDAVIDDINIEDRQKDLHDICYRQFKRQAEASNAERIAKEYQNIRFYDGNDGLKYPSVTSVLDMDKDFHIAQDDLVQYGARGTIIHKQVEIFLSTGEWKEPKDIPGVSFEYMTISKGNKMLVCDDVNFRKFYEKYPFSVIKLEGVVLNHELRYGGRYDIMCVIDSKNKGGWEKVEDVLYDVPTILDIKTSSSLDKDRGLTQQSAYALCDEEVKQVGLIHLNNTVQAGYSKPVITTNLERYQSIFKNQREQFRRRYGI